MKTLLFPMIAAAILAPALPAAPAAYLTADGAIRINGAEHAQRYLEAVDELYAARHPGAKFDLQLKGTSSGIPDLSFGVTLFAPLGREITPLEKVPYEKLVGEDPVEIRIAHAAVHSTTLATSLAAYVNAANPVHQLSRQQLIGLFTTGGKVGDLTRWGQVGAPKPWTNRPVHPVGTPEYTGFGSYLQAHLFHGLPLTPGYELAPETAEILQRISDDPAAVGIAAIGHESKSLRMVATFDRYLYIYLRRTPGQPLDPVVKEYMTLVLSPEGQALMASRSGGYEPLTAEEAAAELAKLDAADPAPAFTPIAAPEPGALYVVGNDGMESMMKKLNDRYTAAHPDAHFVMVMKGSSIGISGLTAGLASIAPIGREAWPADLSGFRETYGYLPLDIKIGYDAYTGPKRKSPPGIYVNQHNPLAKLTLKQVQQIFTSGSPGGDVTRWNQLGLPAAWAGREIHLYGPRDEGGFATSLRLTLLGKLPFAARYESLPKNADIAKAVAADPYGIGLISFFDGSKETGIKLVPLASSASAPAVLPSYEAVNQGQYPFSPNLHLYVNRAPGKPLDPAVAEYVRLVLSPEGQAIIASEKDSDEGYVPLAPAAIASELAKLN